MPAVVDNMFRRDIRLTSLDVRSFAAFDDIATRPPGAARWSMLVVSANAPSRYPDHVSNSTPNAERQIAVACGQRPPHRTMQLGPGSHNLGR
jgi:hypothetical protein